MPDAGAVAVLVIDLHFPHAGSLKAKRAQLHPLTAQLRGRLGLSVAETAHHDLWQRATLSAALCARSPAQAGEAADRVERWLLDRHPDGVSVERHVLTVEDLRA